MATTLYDISPFLPGIFPRWIRREPVGEKVANRIQGSAFPHGWDEPYEARPYVPFGDR